MAKLGSVRITYTEPAGTRNDLAARTRLEADIQAAMVKYHDQGGMIDAMEVYPLTTKQKAEQRRLMAA